MMSELHVKILIFRLMGMSLSVVDGGTAVLDMQVKRRDKFLSMFVDSDLENSTILHYPGFGSCSTIVARRAGPVKNKTRSPIVPHISS